MAKKVNKKVSTVKTPAKVLDEKPTETSSLLIHTQPSLRDCLQQFEKRVFPLKRMVITFAHHHLYKDSPRHALVVRKRKGGLHEGLFNLPGGLINQDEHPHDAALRTLAKETNQDGSQPQLVGAILPPCIITDAHRYIVYIYRVILNSGKNLAFPEDQPADWRLISDARDRPQLWVPCLSVILPLIAADMIGFVLQDTFWGRFHDKKNNDNCQSIVTFLKHKVSDAAISKKQRFTT